MNHHWADMLFCGSSTIYPCPIWACVVCKMCPLRFLQATCLYVQSTPNCSSSLAKIPCYTVCALRSNYLHSSDTFATLMLLVLQRLLVDPASHILLKALWLPTLCCRLRDYINLGNLGWYFVSNKSWIVITQDIFFEHQIGQRRKSLPAKVISILTSMWSYTVYNTLSDLSKHICNT